MYYDTKNGVWNPGEEFVDSNENGVWDEGEDFTDENNFKIFSKNEGVISNNLDFLEKIENHKVFYRAGEFIQNHITYHQAKFFNDNNLAVFIDARSYEEIVSEKGDTPFGRIPNSMVIPVMDLETIDNETEYFYSDMDLDDPIFALEGFENEIKTISALENLSKHGHYIVYCGSQECDKSRNLVERMTDYFNFQNVGLYKGGWEDWLENQAD